MFPIRLSVRRFARGSVTMLDRRSLLVGLLATPAIVKAGSLMAMPLSLNPPLRQHGAMWFSDSGLFVWDALKKEWIKIDDQAAS